jgi:hypothetical protein
MTGFGSGFGVEAVAVGAAVGATVTVAVGVVPGFVSLAGHPQEISGARSNGSRCFLSIIIL